MTGTGLLPVMWCFVVASLRHMSVISPILSCMQALLDLSAMIIALVKLIGEIGDDPVPSILGEEAQVITIPG